MIDPAKFSAALLQWYRHCGRQLPWRATTDPYAVWIAEIMLQQTQVPRVQQRYYPRFLEKFPTLADLAVARWDDVYPVWRGLGFYSRGKNMLRAAQQVVEKFDSELPRTQSELESLPGVGTYTGRAIRAFAHDEKVAAIDTNLMQILTALWSDTDPERIGQQLVEAADSGRDWNNAMMDLATALRAGQEIPGDLGEFFPPEIREKFRPVPKKQTQKVVKKSSKKSPKKSRKFKIEVGAACILRDGKYLIQTRPAGKSFVGQWEFPGGKREKGESFRVCVKREIQEELGCEVSVRPHFCEIVQEFEKTVLVLRFHRCQIQAGEPAAQEGQELRWIAPAKFDGVNFLATNTECIVRLKKMRT